MKGYTVIELIITLAIIGIVATLVVKGIVGVKERNNCVQSGGIMIDDSYGIPTCVKADNVLINPRR